MFHCITHSTSVDNQLHIFIIIIGPAAFRLNQLCRNVMKKGQCPSQDPKKVSWESSSKTWERKDCLECFVCFLFFCFVFFAFFHAHFCSQTSMDIHQSCQWPPRKFSSHCSLSCQVWMEFSIEHRSLNFVPGILSGSAGAEYLSSHFSFFLCYQNQRFLFQILIWIYWLTSYLQFNHIL